MNVKHWMYWLVTLSSALALQPAMADVPVELPPKSPPAPAAPAPGPAAETEPAIDLSQLETALAQPGMAVVNADNVIVRGKPTIKSEVVARLQQGERVSVLEEITRKQPEAGDPAKWYKIGLPKETGVWVHSNYIDGNTKAVTANRLNLRSGPGENYSVLGRVEQGTILQPVETKGDWIKVQQLTNAYAFVAAHLITRETEPPVVAAVEPPQPEPPVTPVTEPPTEVAVVPPPAEVAPTEPAEVAPTEPAEVAPEPMPEVVMPEPAPGTEGEPEALEEDPEVRRTVVREGIVKRSLSIQAPTEFMLESLDTKRTINYLYSPSSNIFLLDFKGQRVRVLGEEGLDDRWPKTPVLTVETLKSVP